MECSACEKQFVNFSNLRKHVKKFHADAVDDLAPLKKPHYQYTCSCGQSFNSMKNFQAHSQTHDVPQPPVKVGLKKCPLCSYQSKAEHECIEHFSTVHDIDIEVLQLEFRTFEDFTRWKEKTEQETISRFVRYRGKSIKNSITHYEFHCHRSGFFNSKGKEVRQLKKQGSSKINGYCPAKMKVLIDPNGQCQVTFFETHVGHDDDLGHLTLTSAERKYIAAKIAAKLPFDTILDEVKQNLSYNACSRLHLLTKKDLYNIRAACNLESGTIMEQIDEVEDVIIEFSEPAQPTTCTKILICSAGTLRDLSLGEEKKELQRHINELIDNIRTKEELDALKRLTVNMEETLSTLQQVEDS